MPDDFTQGYNVSGESMRRIGNTVRVVEGGGRLPPGWDPNRRFPFRMEHVVLIEALKGTLDPNVPTYARAKIKNPVRDGGLYDQKEPNEITIENRTCGCWPETAPGVATEIAPDRWTWTSNYQMKYQGEVLEDVPAAANSLKDPSNGILLVWRKNDAGDMSRTNLEIPFVNRFRHISFDAESYGCIEYMDDEWRAYNGLPRRLQFKPK